MSRSDRKNRTVNQLQGWSGTSSLDFFHLADRLFALSKSDADSLDGNWSKCVWAALPMLLSGLTAYVLERERFYTDAPDERRLQAIQNAPTQEMFQKLFNVPSPLLDELVLLVELRNEIIHPAHMPTGTADNWPNYLRQVKNLGLLNVPEDNTGEFLMLDQMASHRLFAWAVGVKDHLKEIVDAYYEPNMPFGMVEHLAVTRFTQE